MRYSFFLYRCRYRSLYISGSRSYGTVISMKVRLLLRTYGSKRFELGHMLGPEGRVQDRACHHFPKNPQTSEIVNIDSSVPSPQV